MIANFFSKSEPVNTFKIIVLLLGFVVLAIYFDRSYEFSVLYFIKILGFFLGYVVFLLISDFIVRKNKLTEDNSYVLFLIVMLLGTFSESLFSVDLVLANITLLLAFRKLYSLWNSSATKMKIFDAGFWIGISTLIYAWSIVYLLLIFIGILAFRRQSIRNFFIAVLGVCTPLFIYFTYHFYYDNLPFLYRKFSYEINGSVVFYTSYEYFWPLLLLVVFLVWAIITVTPRAVSISTNFKFSWHVLLFHLFIAVGISIMIPVKSGAELVFLIFPSAIIITNLVQRKESVFLKNVILYLFLLMSVGVYFL